ncbi:MAG: leucine--tRNA ligase [Caldilineaceae bacterium]|nr:leucine--tRNA ligase [Caldilineaceae bacterium]
MQKERYNPKAIEPKWQAYWADNQTFKTPTDPQQLATRPKVYILDMFPYPSGDGLHVGHPKGYTASDVIARVRRMQGYNVLHPMGWDAFGLPAERAADRAGMHPIAITQRNVERFRRQLQRVGLSYDWAREVNTSSPDYYRWTQWIFLRLFERGLAYMADVPVNWSPSLGTVLSNEEVHDGKYIETGEPVERRSMRQWMLKITAYAERLLADLDELDWPEGIKEMQRNWIGKSEGAYIDFEVVDDGRWTMDDAPSSIRTFTTRPDTLFGATYLVLAPEHPLVAQVVRDDQRAAITAYVAQAQRQSDLQRTALAQEKSGVFTGAYATNPATGQPIPIWVADYVLVGYGTGAIMAVPGHDERDHVFARQYGLPIVEVVRGGEVPVQEAAFVGEGVAVHSGFLDGLPTAQAKQRIIEWLEATGRGELGVQYRLRDWLFSRQRYWGEPFPLIHLEDGTILPLPEDQLPIKLPGALENPPVDGQPPLARADDDWLMVTLPDGRTGVRETNTMPQWAGSCWYYLRFIDPHNNEQPFDPALERYWMPVDLYIGGVEHAVLHLLYARFWHKVLYDAGVVSTKEPFQKLFNQGLVLANSYQDERGAYYYPHQVEERVGQWVVKETGAPVRTQVEKMSKSRYNVYSLDDVVERYGADALRLYEVFIGPLSVSGPWQMDGLAGVHRFLQRVWRLFVDESSGAPSARVTAAPAASEPALRRMLHKTIGQVTEAVESLDKMNTAVSALMNFANAATQAATLPMEIGKGFLQLLAPFAPHMAEEIWQRLGEPPSIAHAPWPVADPTLAADEIIEIAVQVNGKLRSVIAVAADAGDAALEAAARQDAKVQRALGGASVRRVIIAPGRLVNFLTKA